LDSTQRAIFNGVYTHPAPSKRPRVESPGCGDAEVLLRADLVFGAALQRDAEMAVNDANSTDTGGAPNPPAADEQAEITADAADMETDDAGNAAPAVHAVQTAPAPSTQ
jgi:hypothetical protein